MGRDRLKMAVGLSAIVREFINPISVICSREEPVSETKVLTRHPHGKSGRSISRQSYETVRSAILSLLRRTELTHTELMKSLDATLNGKFNGNISWYGETVKLDLEARKIIERTGTKPERYRQTRRSAGKASR
jgi:Family of unknown function (DUF6958)